MNNQVPPKEKLFKMLSLQLNQLDEHQNIISTGESENFWKLENPLRDQIIDEVWDKFSEFLADIEQYVIHNWDSETQEITRQFKIENPVPPNVTHHVLPFIYEMIIDYFINYH